MFSKAIPTWRQGKAPLARLLLAALVALLCNACSLEGEQATFSGKVVSKLHTPEHTTTETRYGGSGRRDRSGTETVHHEAVWIVELADSEGEVVSLEVEPRIFLAVSEGEEIHLFCRRWWPLLGCPIGFELARGAN